jgi:hypothetical protein
MHGMIENEMGNRGSKSAFIITQGLARIKRGRIRRADNQKNAVKEQRVDGSYFGLSPIRTKFFYPGLRCTLMALEREYHINNLSRQLNCNRLSHSLTNDNPTKLNPYFVTGFVDAEGYFGTSIYKNKKLKTG